MPSRGIPLTRVSVAAVLAAAGALRADVHLVRQSNGSALIFNDKVGSGWRVNGGAPTDAYLVERRNTPSPYDAAVSMMNWLSTLLVKPRLLPRLDFSEGIPSECRTMVVVPTLLASVEGVERLLSHLEVQARILTRTADGALLLPPPAIQRIEGLPAFIALCERLAKRCQMLQMDILSIALALVLIGGALPLLAHRWFHLAKIIHITLKIAFLFIFIPPRCRSFAIPIREIRGGNHKTVFNRCVHRRALPF